jgi:hypothetical protein
MRLDVYRHVQIAVDAGCHVLSISRPLMTVKADARVRGQVQEEQADRKRKEQKLEAEKKWW